MGGCDLGVVWCDVGVVDYCRCHGVQYLAEGLATRRMNSVTFRMAAL